MRPHLVWNYISAGLAWQALNYEIEIRALPTACAGTNVATHWQILYNFRVEYPFPPVGIVGAADGKNRRAFLCFLVNYLKAPSSLTLRKAL